LPLMKALIAGLQSLADFISTTAGKATLITVAVATLGFAIVPLI